MYSFSWASWGKVGVSWPRHCTCFVFSWDLAETNVLTGSCCDSWDQSRWHGCDLSAGVLRSTTPRRLPPEPALHLWHYWSHLSWPPPKRQRLLAAASRLYCFDVSWNRDQAGPKSQQLTTSSTLDVQYYGRRRLLQAGQWQWQQNLLRLLVVVDDSSNRRRSPRLRWR